MRVLTTVGAEATDTALPRAWAVKAYGEDRTYLGNHGHADEIGGRYCYDNFVPYHKQLDVGHVVILRGKSCLRGVAVIGDVDSWDDTKARQVCPKCRKPNIKFLETARRYSCQRTEC